VVTSPRSEMLPVKCADCRVPAGLLLSASWPRCAAAAGVTRGEVDAKEPHATSADVDVPRAVAKSGGCGG
jgi:hypothetical protein